MDQGAYGLRIAGAPESSALLQGPSSTWPAWSVSWRRQAPIAGQAAPTIGAAEAQVPLQGEGELSIDRDSARIDYRLARGLSAHALAHPFLAPAAAIVASWMGRLSLHAGAFLHRGGAWVVLGDAGTGKSTLMAALAGAGVTILADDLSVVDGGRVMAGPRCVDLRDDAARWLGAGDPLGTIGGRERWRVRLAAAPAEAPIRGFLTLAWGDRVQVDPLPAPERLSILMRHRAIVRGTEDAELCLDLARLPMLRASRRRVLTAAREDAGALVRLLPYD